MIPQFPAPLALRSLKTTEAVQARHDRRSRHSKQRRRAVQAPLGCQAA